MNGDLTLYAEWMAITAPTAKTLTYTGQPQELVNAGSAAAGSTTYDMKYSLAENGTYDTAIPTGTGADNYDVYYEVVGADGTTVLYGPESASASIGKAPLTVAADSKTAMYGDAAPAYTASYSGFVNNEDESSLAGTLSYACGYAQGSAAGSYTITPSGLTSSNYDITFSPGTLTVGKKALTVTADTKTKAYGESDPALTYASSGLVGSDSITGALARAAGEAVGTYAITQGTLSAGSNYDISFTGADFTITGAAPGMVPPTPNALTYNGTNQDLVMAGSSADGVMLYSLAEHGSYSPTIPTGKDVGTYTVWYMVRGDSNHADSTPASVSVTIDQREAALSWANTSFAYDKASHVPTASVSNLISGDSCTVTVTGDKTDAGTYTATATGLSNSNYKLPSSVTQSFTITPKQVGITWTGDSFVYNGQQQSPTATANGIESGDTCNVMVTGGQTNAGGSYTATAALDSPNYVIASGAGTHSFTITPRMANLTWSNTSLTYNGAAQKPTATVSNLVSGDSCDVTVGGEQTHAGTYTATATALSNPNYTLVLATGTSTPFSIAKAALTVTAKPGTITYGEAPIGDGVTYAGFVGGDGAGSLSGALAYDFSYSQYGNVGSYTITPKGLTSNDYVITFADGTLTVNPREVTLVWSSPSAFDYTGSEKTWPVPAVGNTVNGDAITAVWKTATSGASDAYAATTAGTYAPEVATLSGDKASNYKLPANKVGSWSINSPGTNSMTVSIAGWTYGQAQNSPTATADFGASTATYTYWADAACTQPADGSNAGNAPVNAGSYWVKGDIAATSNYPAASATCPFTIAKAKVTVTADDKQSVRSDSGTIATLTYTVAPSLVGSDSLDDFVEAASDIAPNQINPAKTGSYVIKAGYKPDKSAADVSNYDITFADGTYTVTRALANVTAAGYTGTYDGTDTGKQISVTVSDSVGGKDFAGNGAANVKIYYSESDFRKSLGLTSADVTALQGDNVSTPGFRSAWTSLQLKLASCSEDELAYKDAGTHKVYFMVVSDQVSPDVIFGSKDVVINKAQLTVTANNKAIAYGDAAANGGVRYSGFVNGESESVLSGTPAYGYGGYAVGSPVGNYPIAPSGLTAANYDITYAPGTLTVGQAELTLTWPTPDSLVYNGSAQSYGPPTLSTPRAGDDVKVELNAGTGTATNAGDYTATVARLAGAAASNYKLAAGAQLSHDWHITPADLVVKAKDKTITYGDEPANGGVEYTALLGSDDEASLEGALVYSYDYARYGNVGAYKITPSGLTSPNYNITFQDGTLTVLPRELELTWPELHEFDYTGGELTYGPPELSGAVNGDDVGIGTYSGDKATDAGTHTAKVESLSNNDAGNYKLPANASRDWTIRGAANQASVALEGWTYGDEAKMPVVDATFGKDTAVVEYAASADGPWSAEKPTAAGAYWVRATVPAAHSYDGAEATAQFTIAKRPVTVTALDQVVEVGGAIDSSAGQATLSNAAAGDALSAVALAATSTAEVTENGTITPSAAVVKNAAGDDMAASYEFTYKPGKLLVVGVKGAENGKVVYAMAKDVWLTVEEAAALLAASDADAQMVKLADVRGIDTATGEALDVQVADRGGLAAVAGEYKVTFKVNPEVQVTFHVTGTTPGSDPKGSDKPGSSTTTKPDKSRSTAASAKTGDAPLTFATGSLLFAAVVAAGVLAVARRKSVAHYHGAHVRK